MTVGADDLITLINHEGRATVLVLPFTEEGTIDASLIGAGGDGLTAVETNRFDARALTGWADAHTRGDAPLRALSAFGPDSPAGERSVHRAQAAGRIWFALPVPREGAVTDGGGGLVSIEVQSASAPGNALPEPLGAVRDEFQVDRATAHAYEIKAGEMVQIIDIDGCQCSDFMAVRADALEAGLERFIDGTVTRSMVRGAFPLPGLADKFYDQDMVPLLSVVRDTVGRHDTFGLACTARGYEDRGYLGHVNCSDNISDAYEPFSITRRAAWPAVNLFFNSWILPTDNVFGAGEGWSRPGDYIVMKALTDLVCVSTACPDDVDPINGWNPTDVHVRIYKPDAPISRAVAYRPETHSEAILTQESAFHPRTSALTQQFHAVRDVWLPAKYDATGALEEYWACRNAVAVQDMSSLRKFDIMGPDAEELLQRALTKNARKLAVNRGVYALMLDETGAVIDDGTLFRMSPEVFRWCCGSDESGRTLKAIAEEMNLRVWIKSHFNAMANLAVQGPKSRELLSRIVFTQPTHPTLESLKWFGWTVARLHDREGAPFMLTRTGYTGELGYELFCDRADALEIWDALFEAGSDLGIQPMGAEALGMIRVEAGFMAAGAEFGPDVDALEAGLGFAIAESNEDYVGRAAIQRNREAPRRELVGLLLSGDEVPAHGDGIFVGTRQIGTVTSATRSPELGQAIAMARVATEHAADGTELEVGCLDGHMKRLSATVTGLPFVDPTRERARS